MLFRRQAVFAGGKPNKKKHCLRNASPRERGCFAYTQVVDACYSGNAKALDKAINVAVNERTRYYAERIARTETAKAWYDGFIVRAKADSDVVAFRWNLSSRHPVYNICNLYAYADLYGLDAGIYPMDAVPSIPVHPHCMCMLSEVYKGEVDASQSKDNAKKGGEEWLDGLSSIERKQLLGVKGAEAYSKGADWRQYMPSYKAAGEPVSRLEDLQSGGGRGIIRGNEGNSEKVQYPKKIVLSRDEVHFDDNKLLLYSLDPNASDGGNKARVFNSALGYNLSNWEHLKEQTLSLLDKYRLIKGTIDKYGARYSAIMQMTGINNRKANVLVAWIYDVEPKQGIKQPRLSTIYVTESKERGLIK